MVIFSPPHSAQHDYESDRLVREQRIAELEELTQSLRATHRTTEQELEQFVAAINQYKENKHSLRYTLLLHSDQVEYYIEMNSSLMWLV